MENGNGAVIEKIRSARTDLRSRGERDSMNAVRRAIGGSKGTIAKYWSATAPAEDAAPPAPGPPVNGDTSPVADNDEAFEATFAAYLDAASKFGAVSGLRVRYAYPPQHGRRAPDLTRDYDLSRRHPKYEELEEALRQAYAAHVQAWRTMEGYEEAKYRAAEPEPEPEPAPEPELSLANLRLYYGNRPASAWPDGMTRALPVAVYSTLQTLWREANAAIGKADRQHYDTRNALSQQGVRDLDHHPELRQVDTRRSVARLTLHAVQSDMDTVRMRAHREGIELKDPRLS